MGTAGVLLALTTARWLLPAEATAEGETLGIAAWWFAAGALVCLLRLPVRRFDLADAAVALLIGGHVLGGLVVVLSVGDRRAALNLAWEWLSLGVFWFAWRKALVVPDVRRQLVPLLLVTAATLSLWGLWQYFVWYPQIAAKYGPLFDQLKQLEASGSDASGVRKQLAEAGIPTDGPSLLLFENRLRNSREPFGPFALANTFGGLLAAWLVLGAGAFLRDASKKRPFATRAGAVLLLALTALALYLTNSRTAWVGALGAGAAAAVVIGSQRVSSPNLRRLIFPAAVAAAGLLGLALLAVIMQDEHAVPGPLKSLAYRAEYWIGTWRLLASTSWLGVGPGQFRDRYLEFKLPGSSEEIADPHNLILDVWSNGGVFALAGLSGLIVILLHHLRQPSSAWSPLPRFGGEGQGEGASGHAAGFSGASQAFNSKDKESPRESAVKQVPPLPNPLPGRGGEGTQSPPASLWRYAGIAAFAFVFAGQLLTTGVWDDHADRLVVFGAIWLALSWIVPKFFRCDAADLSWLGLLAALALTIHLLGAGGIAMPAVTQLWLLLIAWGITPVVAQDASASRGEFPPQAWLSAGVCLALCAGCALTGWRPVTAAAREVERGDDFWSNKHDGNRAGQSYRRAAEIDDLWAEPRQRLADLEFAQTSSSGTRLDRERLEAAIRWQDEAIRRAPFRPAGYLRKAEMRFEVARRTRSPADWEAAALAFRPAEARTPTNAGLLANFAVALSHAGLTEEAMDTARRALAQDELNRSRGHTDRYLSEATLRELARILEPIRLRFAQ